MTAPIRERRARRAAADDVALIGHLMRRAAFGARAEHLEQLARKSYGAVVDDLVNPERFPPLEEDLLERFHSDQSDDESTGWTATRWSFQMINSPRPLEFKMALFWHGLFATAVSKVTNNPMMRNQYQMLRENGLSDFRTILQRLARDPAMLYWLDQQQNHAAAVNENWGRELLELFSMGRGNYTEDDVKAAARAFTGWTLDQTFPRYPSGYYDVRFVYRPEDHDETPKTFLGRTGNFNGDDIIDIILEQPATAHYLALHLYKFFVSDEPNRDEVEALAQTLTESRFDIRVTLKAMFLSEYFRQARFKRVRSPAEHVIATVRIAGRYTNAWEHGIDGLEDAIGRMGQQLLNPPTVEGWHPGREWIDSAYLIERVNFAADMLGDPSAPGVVAISRRIAGGRSGIEALALVDAVLYEMGALMLSPAAKQAIIENLELVGEVACNPPEVFANTVARVCRTISTAREFQLE
ncbi:MAG: DUF1800 domain-containing protein [Chloroflexi bacterium]|nr:DUF1800 domain-containing protein [Chloroflexota bacterium]